jgi:hypothetical protein
MTSVPWHAANVTKVPGGEVITVPQGPADHVKVKFVGDIATVPEWPGCKETVLQPILLLINPVEFKATIAGDQEGDVKTEDFA